jgi:cytochrome c oxidase subunit 2
VDRPGVYFGQCSELCGTKHGFMPIAIEVLPPEKFNAWVAAKEAENGNETPGPRFQAGADGKLTRIVAAPAAAAAAAAAAAPAAL